MEQNVDVFSLVISKLNDNDMWFTTKADPTVEEARNYYKLDEYGNPTETTINKIVKEVNALIGDGAVNEYDAVDLWVNDALVAYTVDYRDNLVTQFEDKPVVDGIEAYENSVQFPKSKKTESNKKERFYVQGPDEFDIENGLEDTPSWDIMDSNTDDFYYDENGNNYHFYSEDEAIKACKKLNNKKTENKTKKTEGAGAGYTVSGTLTNIGVNSYEILDTYVDNSDYGGQEKCFVLKCDIDVDIEDMKFSSYEYGGEIEFPVKAKITNLVLFDYDYDEDSSENVELDEAGIIGALEDITFEDVLGAGWVHQAFTGTFETSIDGSSYSVLTADNCTISIDNEKVIDYIDNKVTGNIDLYTYAVLDEEGEELKDDFSDEEEAIKYAQEHNGVKVARIYHNWELIDADGSLDDEPENEVIWERDYDKHYKYDNEVNESKNRNVNFNIHTKDKKAEALEDNFYSAFDSHGFRRKIDKDTTIEELINELYNFITFENISKDDTRKAIEDIVYHINIQLNANLDASSIYLWYINGNYGGTYEKVRKNKITENYQKRLDEVNNKSKNLISSMFTDSSFDSDSPAGQIVMRTSEMFNALSDKGYDVEVTFDNGESTSAIQLGQQGGKVLITITNTDQPLRAFTSGNFEINDQNIKILQDIQDQIKVL